MVRIAVPTPPVDDFAWLPDVVDKLAAKHNVTQDKAKDVSFDRLRYRYVESGHRMSLNQAHYRKGEAATCHRQGR
jgi:hypothetical protein